MCDDSQERFLAAVELAYWRNRNVKQHIAIDDEGFFRLGIKRGKAARRSKRCGLDYDSQPQAKRRCCGLERWPQPIAEVSRKHSHASDALALQDAHLTKYNRYAANRQECLGDVTRRHPGGART
jgi:hypothetical protein